MQTVHTYYANIKREYAVQMGCNVFFYITVKFGCRYKILGINKIMLYFLYRFTITDKTADAIRLQTAEVIIFQNANVMRYCSCSVFSCFGLTASIYASFHKFVGQKQLSTRTLQISN